MPSAPYDNYLHGLKDQVNIQLCSMGCFKEDRKVFSAVGEHSLGQKKSVCWPLFLKLYIILSVNVISATAFKHDFIISALLRDFF